MKKLLLFTLWIGARVLFGQDAGYHFDFTLLNADAHSLVIQLDKNKTYSSAEIHYGTSPADLVYTYSYSTKNPEETDGYKTIKINGLSPSTVYWIEVEYATANGTFSTGVKQVITSSAVAGEIYVMFNFDVDPAYSNGSSPLVTGTAPLESQIIDYILNATQTIDVCMYNVDRDAYINALKQAAANGVQVRYIAESKRSNLSLNTTLNFPVLYASGEGIMHNKFVIIDKDIPAKAKVLTGSYNFTDSNLYEGYNNVVIVQDKSLAEIYTTEFEEMWGSSGPQPNANNSKTGADKTDNTPHTVFVNGTKIEVYFSPSDYTTSKIVNAINTTDHDLRFGLLAFTNDDIENAIMSLPATVKGLIENQYNGTATAQFQANGQAVYDFEQAGHFLHHKYAVIDAEVNGSDPIVVTGSHNWTYSAEYKNDENTLIIHNADIANIYLQEFEARWKTVVAVEDAPGDSGIRLKVFPNPASGALFINNRTSRPFRAQLVNPAGQPVLDLECAGHSTKQLDISRLPQGVYMILPQGPSVSQYAKVVILR